MFYPRANINKKKEITSHSCKSMAQGRNAKGICMVAYNNNYIIMLVRTGGCKKSVRKEQEEVVLIILFLINQSKHITTTDSMNQSMNMDSLLLNSLFPIDTSLSNSLYPLPPADYFKDFDFVSNDNKSSKKRVFDQSEVTDALLVFDKEDEYKVNQKQIKKQDEVEEIKGIKGMQAMAATFQFTLDSTCIRNVKIRKSTYKKILEIPKDKRTFIMTESLNAPYIHFLLQRESSGAPKRKYRRKIPSKERSTT